MMSRRTCVGSFLVVVGLAIACDSDPAASEPSEEAGVPRDSKACPSDTPEFNLGPAGLSSEPNEKLGIRAHLVDASSHPPQNGFNDWTVEVTDLEGNVLPHATLVWACAFMPAHGHGTNPRTVTSLGNGRFELQKQNMAMEGGWQIELWVDPEGEAENFSGGRSALDRRACISPTNDLEPLVLKACVPG